MKIDFREIEMGRREYDFRISLGNNGFEYPGVEFNSEIIASVLVLVSGDEIVLDGKRRQTQPRNATAA